jgi:uncharacterized repeat protein (TIGR03803 family)
LTTLHSFSRTWPNTDGSEPFDSVIQGNDGDFYGTTSGGGANGNGTIFEISSTGTLTTLHTFSTLVNYENVDGATSYAGLLLGTDGNFYGTAYFGGTYGFGAVFRLNVSQTPTLSSLNPNSVNAAGPAFTLTAKGNNFTNTSTVYWTAGSATALTTTYVSANQLKAVVPASLIASPGTVKVTVVTPGTGTSNAKTFIILGTTLKLFSATISKDNASNYTAKIALKNFGYLAANTVKITKSTLGAATTTTTLPASVGNIAAGATAGASLTYPASAGTSGTVVYLKVSGTFAGGKFVGSLKVTLP